MWNCIRKSPAVRAATLSTMIVGSLVSSSQAFAQTYPSRPVKLIVTSSAGGSTDVIARPITMKMSDLLGQPVVIENVPGGNTSVGADRAAKSAPDGYTLFLASSSSHVLNPVTRKRLSYDAVKDFTPVMLTVSSPYIIVARPELGVNTLPELIALAKKRPGMIKYGMSVGSPAHFASESLASAAGVKFLGIPYKDSAQATKDIVVGEVDFAFTPLSSVATLVDAKRLKVLGAASHQRMKQLPNVPTLGEHGFKGFWAGAWLGIVAKAGTPEQIIRRLNTDLNRALKDPEVRGALEKIGYDIHGGTPEEFQKFMDRDREVMGRVAREANIQIE